MTLTRTRDLALVHALVTAPGSFDAARDDSVQTPADWQPSDDERIVYLLADDQILYTLFPLNTVCFEIHTTRAFGAEACAALRGAVEWGFRNTPARRIVAQIPAPNRIAIRHALACGFRQYGCNPRSYLRGGELVDQVLLGRSPENGEQHTWHR